MLLWLGSALAADSYCSEARLATLEDEVRGLQPGQIVAASAAALEDACRGWNDMLEAAGDIAVVSPERRRALDMEVAKRDARWLEGCPDGEKVLSASIRMPRADGRAAVWDGCELDRLQVFTREEWVNGLDGLLVMPIAASVLLPEVGIDFEVSEIVVRGLAGLPPPPEASKRTIAMPTMEELAAADEAARTTPKVPVPVVVPAVLPTPVPVPVAVPSAEPEVPSTTTSVVTIPPAFREGGQVKPRWSSAALVAGGSCVARIRVGPTGEMVKITFIECPDLLQPAVTKAAQQSKYRPAMAGEYPATGAFRARWTVPGS